MPANPKGSCFRSRMSSRRNKGLAIVFIVLFLGYYQRWLYAVIYETVGGSLDLDPSLPMIINGVRKLRNQDDGMDLEERSEILEKDGNSGGAGISTMTFLKTDRKLQAQANELSERIQRDITASQNAFSNKQDCKGPKLHCGSNVGTNYFAKIYLDI